MKKRILDILFDYVNLGLLFVGLYIIAIIFTFFLGGITRYIPINGIDNFGEAMSAVNSAGGILAAIIFALLVYAHKRRGSITYASPWLMVAALLGCVSLASIMRLSLNQQVSGFGPLADSLIGSAIFMGVAILIAGFVYYLVVPIKK